MMRLRWWHSRFRPSPAGAIIGEPSAL